MMRHRGPGIRFPVHSKAVSLFMRYSRYLLLAGMALVTAAPSVMADDNVTVSSLVGLQTAIDNAPASGRTITLEKGVYHQIQPLRIQGQQHLTIQGATDDYDDTVLEGLGINNPSLYVNIKVNNADDLTLRNLTVRDSYYHGVQINNDSDHFVADHIKTLDNGESGFKITSPSNASGPAAYSDDGLIENSYIGFSDSGQRSVVEGVDMVAVRGWTLRDNTFERIRKADGHPAYAAFAKGHSQDVVFEGNVVKDSFIGLSFGGGGTSPQYFRNGDTSAETEGGIIRNNTVEDTTDVGIYMNKARGFDIIDNTVVDNGKQTGSIAIRYGESDGDVSNNQTSGPIRLRDHATAWMTGNTEVEADETTTND